MADQENVLDLLDQAISCELPHLHGVVNLNRLHEVLSRLVSQKCLETCNVQNSSIPITIVSHSSEPYETLSSVQQTSATKGNAMHIANSIALATNTSELDADNADEPRRTVTNPPGFPHQTSSSSLLDQTCSQDVFAVSQKLKELEEKLNTIEANVHELEEVCIKARSQCHAAEENIRGCTSKTTLSVHSEVIANVVESTINTVGSQTRSSISPKMTAESEMRFQQSLPQQKVLRPGKSFETRSTLTRFSVETQTDSSTHNGELVDKRTLNCEKGQTDFPAFAELRNIVEALTEREAELHERQTQLERTITSYMEALNCRLEAKGNNDTTFPKCQDVKSKASFPFVQDDSISNLSVFTPSQHPDPHDAAEKLSIGYFTTFESEIRSTLGELRKEIRLLEAKTNESHDVSEKLSFDYLTSFVSEIRSTLGELRKEIRLLEAKTNESHTRHAAGGRLPLESKHRVKCISCDGLADMNLLTEHVSKPMLLSTNRCLKPFLRNQLNLLQKDMKYWTDTSDILQYRRFLKKR